MSVKRETEKRERALPSRFLRLHGGFWLATYGLATALVVPFTSLVLGLPAARAALLMIGWTVIGAALSSSLLVMYERVLARVQGWVPIPILALSSTAAAIVWAKLANRLHGPLPPMGPATSRAIEQPPELGLCIVVLLLWTAIVYAAHQAHRARGATERSLELRALAAEAELHALQGELHPHLLFNALNAVVGAIDDDREKAKALVRDLSDLLRHTLSAATTPATVASELQLAKLYLAVQKARFEDRLQVVWQIPLALEAEPVPAMVLQPLIENALKHGRASQNGALRVCVKVSGNEETVVLEVRNTGSLASPRPGGVGLRNLRERLARIFDAEGAVHLAVDGGEVVASVNVPRRPV